MQLTDEQFERLYKLCEDRWRYVGKPYPYEAALSKDITIAVERITDSAYRTVIIDYTEDFLTQFPPAITTLENGEDFAKKVFSAVDKKTIKCLKERQDRLLDLLK